MLSSPLVAIIFTIVVIDTVIISISTQLCTSLYNCAQICTAVHKSAQMCASLHSCAYPPPLDPPVAFDPSP